MNTVLSAVGVAFPDLRYPVENTQSQSLIFLLKSLCKCGMLTETEAGQINKELKLSTKLRKLLQIIGLQAELENVDFLV